MGDVTKQSYEDETIVENYIKLHADNPAFKPTLDKFLASLRGKKVLDIGCGPGHDAYYFASKGFDVTGIDYSQAMIKAAQSLRQQSEKPTFFVLNIEEIADKFDKHSFDGIWACASLLHVAQQDIGRVLQQIYTVAKPDATVYISIKEGEIGEKMVNDTKYGKPANRIFSFWSDQAFTDLLKQNNFVIIESSAEVIGSGKNKTTWLGYFLGLKH